MPKTEYEPPDFNDPFGPDTKSTRAMNCLHCGKNFEERQVVWQHRHGQWLWWCPTVDCDGAGVGFDIIPAENTN